MCVCACVYACVCVCILIPSYSGVDDEEEGGGGVGGGWGSGEESEEEEGGREHFVSLSQQLKGGFIPNADFIHRARREREERRQTGGGDNAPSVIPLSTNRKVQMAKGKSRLVREDDNDRSDDSGGEEGGRRLMDAGQHDTTAVKQFQVRNLVFCILSV